MYEGHMGKAKGGGFEGGGGDGWCRWCGGVKMETMYLNNNKKINKNSNVK